MLPAPVQHGLVRMHMVDICIERLRLLRIEWLANEIAWVCGCFALILI